MFWAQLRYFCRRKDAGCTQVLATVMVTPRDTVKESCLNYVSWWSLEKGKRRHSFIFVCTVPVTDGNRCLDRLYIFKFKSAVLSGCLFWRKEKSKQGRRVSVKQKQKNGAIDFLVFFCFYKINSKIRQKSIIKLLSYIFRILNDNKRSNYQTIAVHFSV